MGNLIPKEEPFDCLAHFYSYKLNHMIRLEVRCDGMGTKVSTETAIKWEKMKD